ncbi:MAG TPA: hypothetical protein VHT92_01720 [Candidatus Cybelea sp.]|nr:hypothetical protein [Candidatus Cybelea sp.]
MRAFRAAALTTLFLAACSSPAPNQRVDDAEVTALAPLKQKYSDTVMGFDVKPQTTLIVSLDLQHYIDADDDTVAALKRDALARWRAVWSAAHPHAHATLRVHFIDFIGRSVATESTKV